MPVELLNLLVGALGAELVQVRDVEPALGRRRARDAAQPRDLLGVQARGSRSGSSSSALGLGEGVQRPSGEVVERRAVRSPIAARTPAACRAGRRAEMIAQAAASYGQWKSTGRWPWCRAGAHRSPGRARRHARTRRRRGRARRSARPGAARHPRRHRRLSAARRPPVRRARPGAARRRRSRGRRRPGTASRIAPSNASAPPSFGPKPNSAAAWRLNGPCGSSSGTLYRSSAAVTPWIVSIAVDPSSGRRRSSPRSRTPARGPRGARSGARAGRARCGSEPSLKNTSVPERARDDRDRPSSRRPRSSRAGSGRSRRTRAGSASPSRRRTRLVGGAELRVAPQPTIAEIRSFPAACATAYRPESPTIDQRLRRRVVIRDVDHRVQERVAERVDGVLAEGVEPPQVGDEQHRLDDARRSERRVDVDAGRAGPRCRRLRTPYGRSGRSR